MLDTIITELPKDDFWITKPERFGPLSPAQLENSHGGFAQTFNNPNSADKQKGLYLPRLTLLKRGNRQFLKAEFSAPKLLFGNNVDEIAETDKEALLKSLRDKLAYMGVMVWSHKLSPANVIGFHLGKNVPLKREYPADFVIRQLKRVADSAKMDFTERTFINNGEALYLYAKSHSLIIYDKIKDLDKPAARAIDKDQAPKQMNLFDDWRKANLSPPNLLRLEVRMNEKRAINQCLQATDFPSNQTLGQLFNAKMQKSVIQAHWNDYFGNNIFLLSLPNQPLDLLQNVFNAFPKKSTKEIMEISGIASLLSNAQGISGFKRMLRNNGRGGSWKMIKKKLEIVAEAQRSPVTPEYITAIEESLATFSPIRKEALKSCPL